MCNLPHGFDIYLVNVKTMRKIAQIFVAFSEKLNFNAKHLPYVLQQASCRQPYEPYSCNRLKTLHVTKKLTGKIKEIK